MNLICYSRHGQGQNISEIYNFVPVGENKKIHHRVQFVS